MNKMKSIETLEGDRWGEAPENAPRLVKRAYALRQIPIEQLGIEELRLLLNQGIGIAFVLPLAVDVLERDPLAEGDFYPGDLLQSVLNVSTEYWSAHPRLKKRLESSLRKRKSEVETRPISEEIRRDLNRAINRFLASSSSKGRVDRTGIE
jgi:CDI immunity proteins